MIGYSVLKECFKAMDFKYFENFESVCMCIYTCSMKLFLKILVTEKQFKEFFQTCYYKTAKTKTEKTIFFIVGILNAFIKKVKSIFIAINYVA